MGVDYRSNANDDGWWIRSSQESQRAVGNDAPPTLDSYLLSLNSPHPVILGLDPGIHFGLSQLLTE